MKWLLVSLLFLGTAEARLGVDIEWGFMQGKAIFVEDANGNMGGGSNWEYVDLSFMAINRDSTMMAYGVWSQGFRATSSVLTTAGDMNVEVECYMIGLQVMRFLTQPGQRTRFYFRGGPVLAHLEATVSGGGARTGDQPRRVPTGVSCRRWGNAAYDEEHRAGGEHRLHVCECGRDAGSVVVHGDDWSRVWRLITRCKHQRCMDT